MSSGTLGIVRIVPNEKRGLSTFLISHFSAGSVPQKSGRRLKKRTAMDRLAFIWDLDGTLLDSYGIIVSSLYQAYREFGVELDKEEIHREVISFSVGEFLGYSLNIESIN